VKNIGDKFGKEVVQLYLTDKESKLKRPTKELKGFKKNCFAAWRTKGS
jgi:beta-glucosidase